jgi:hypothetical protein
VFVVDSNGNPVMVTLDPGKSIKFWYWWSDGNWHGQYMAQSMNVYSEGPFVVNSQGMRFHQDVVKYLAIFQNIGSSSGGFHVTVGSLNW